MAWKTEILGHYLRATFNLQIHRTRAIDNIIGANPAPNVDTTRFHWPICEIL